MICDQKKFESVQCSIGQTHGLIQDRPKKQTLEAEEIPVEEH